MIKLWRGEKLYVRRRAREWEREAKGRKDEGCEQRCRDKRQMVQIVNQKLDMGIMDALNLIPINNAWIVIIIKFSAEKRVSFNPFGNFPQLDDLLGIYNSCFIRQIRLDQLIENVLCQQQSS